MPTVRMRFARPRPAWRAVSAMATAVVLATTLVSQSSIARAATEVNFTDFPGTFSFAEAKTGDEGPAMAVDGYTDTKYFTDLPTTWLQFRLTTSAVVNRYTITSANDFPGRDPQSWVLEASNNGSSYQTLDTRTGQQFASRFLERSFSFTNSTAYRYYRLRILSGNGDGLIQLSEWQLFGPSSTPAPLTAPTGLTATGVSGDQVLLTWTKAHWQKSFDVERSTDGVNWTAASGAVNLRNEFHDYTALPSTTYRYRVRGRSPAGVSAWVNTQATTPALTPPQNTTATNGKAMTLRYQNSDVAVYTEPTLTDAAARWSYPEITRIWQYTKQQYPGFGNDRLQVFMFAERGGGSAFQRIDKKAGYHSTIEVGWSAETDEGRLDVIAHETGHLVDGWRNGVSGSPGAGLWADSQWCDFFTYDLYQGLGLTADATRVYNQRIVQAEAFPRAGTYWFRDWFYPIWRDYGRTSVLNRYFDLVSTQFPTVGQKHPRDFNYGEFVHFFSGAAGVDLQPRAAQAFGWPAEYQEQLVKARLDFPGVVYPHS